MGNGKDDNPATPHVQASDGNSSDALKRFIMMVLCLMVLMVRFGIVHEPPGNADLVRCFRCGGGLRNWDPSDDPLEAHARFFSHCDHIKDLSSNISDTAHMPLL